MWGWLQRLITGTPPPGSTRSTSDVSVSQSGGFWTRTSGPSLAQGDLLHDCLVPIFEPTFRAGLPSEEVVSVGKADLVVVTQTCDLENQKARFVALCPIHSLEKFSAVNSRFANKNERNEIRKGRYEGLHMLASPGNPSDNLQALIVDFREIYSLPFGYLCRHAESCGLRWRLQSPFLEHLSQAFARFFMRVGLPSSIPPFK